MIGSARIHIGFLGGAKNWLNGIAAMRKRGMERSKANGGRKRARRRRCQENTRHMTTELDRREQYGTVWNNGEQIPPRALHEGSGVVWNLC